MKRGRGAGEEKVRDRDGVNILEALGRVWEVGGSCFHARPRVVIDGIIGGGEKLGRTGGQGWTLGIYGERNHWKDWGGWAGCFQVRLVVFNRRSCCVSYFRHDASVHIVGVVL